jgi:hypothetical protein
VQTPGPSVAGLQRHRAHHGATINTTNRPKCPVLVRTANDADIGTGNGGQHAVPITRISAAPVIDLHQAATACELADQLTSPPA